MDRPIRVLHVLPSLSKSTGVARFVYNMYRYHDEDRVHFDFLHHANIDGKLIDANTYDQELEDNGSRVFRVNQASAGLLRFMREVHEVFQEHGNEYDIVHCHMPNSAFCVLKDAKEAGVQHRIVHSHLNNSSDKFFHRLRNIPLNAIGKHYATDFLACSKDAGRFLFGSKPFKVINNGIPIERFAFNSQIREDLRSSLRIPQDSIVIGCVGRMAKQKNYPFVVKVFSEFLKKYSSAVLLIAGDGEERGRIEQMVEEMGIKDSVLLLGVRNDINKLYSVMDVFFMPSLYEGLPVSAVEAQAAGLPCVYSTDVPRESDITGTGVFVNRGEDIQRWVQRLEEKTIGMPRLLSNVDLLKKNGYSASENAAVLESYYAKVVSK